VPPQGRELRTAERGGPRHHLLHLLHGLLLHRPSGHPAGRHGVPGLRGQVPAAAAAARAHQGVHGRHRPRAQVHAGGEHQAGQGEAEPDRRLRAAYRAQHVPRRGEGDHHGSLHAH